MTSGEGRTCEEQLKDCRPSTRRWLVDYFSRLKAASARLPQCSGDGNAYLQDHVSPMYQRVLEEIGTQPVDPDCGFIGWYSGTYNIDIRGATGRTPVIVAPGRIDLNVNLGLGGGQEPKPEPNAAPQQPEEVRVESKIFFLRPDAGPSRRFHISALGNVGGYSGTAFGVGGLFGVPLRSSLIPVINDALFFEGGARFNFVNLTGDVTGTFLQLMGGVRWDFYLSKEWSVYVAARFTPVFSVNALSTRFLSAGGAAGFQWRFVEALALRVEGDGSNYGGSVNAGFTLFF